MGLPATTGSGTTAIQTAAQSAIVMWRGRRLPFEAVPDEVAAISGRGERELLYGAWREALEALNPGYRHRLEAWLAAGDPAETAASVGADPRSLATDLERFVLHGETPYYAALRRYLALIDIEQGDAT